VTASRPAAFGVRRPPAPERLGRAGFTLVELLVAVTLMVILTGTITFVFLRAQQIFTRVDARVQVYQYARHAFDQMERDLANTIATRNMEFFNDRKMIGGGTKGEYDANEEIPIRGTANRDGDPSGGDRLYNHAFTLRQPDRYRGEKDALHRRDSIYFKTVTVANGETTAALIEYAMIDHDKPRPKMIKRTWRVTGVDMSNQLAPRFQVNGNDRALPVESDLCLYCTDAVFEIFVQNRRRGDAGDFYACEDLVAEDSNGEGGPPQGAHGGPVFEPLKDYWRGSHRMMQCYYDPDHDDGNSQADWGLLEKDEDGDYSVFRTQRGFTFPMLTEGDTIFLYPPNASSPLQKGQVMRIKDFVRSGGAPWTSDAPRSELRIRFDEKVEIPAATSGDIEVGYRAGWVPPAVRVSLRIKDAKSRELRSVSRIFKILGN